MKHLLTVSFKKEWLFIAFCHANSVSNPANVSRDSLVLTNQDAYYLLPCLHCKQSQPIRAFVCLSQPIRRLKGMK
jgi:hypothetical protein